MTTEITNGGRAEPMTDRTNGEKPLASRGPDGQFLPGGSPGPGRPRGSRNAATLDVRRLKQRIMDSWDRVGADALLDEYAKSDFAGYLRLVVGLLPRDATLGVSAGLGAVPTQEVTVGGETLLVDIIERAGLPVRDISEPVASHPGGPDNTP